MQAQRTEARPNVAKQTIVCKQSQNYRTETKFLMGQHNNEGVAGMCSISLHAFQIAFGVVRRVRRVALWLCLCASAQHPVKCQLRKLDISKYRLHMFMCVVYVLAWPTESSHPPSSISDMILRCGVRAKKTTRMNYGNIV